MIDKKEELRQQLRQAALEYHEFPTPGKISVTPTKLLTNQRDLAGHEWRNSARSQIDEIGARPTAIGE